MRRVIILLLAVLLTAHPFTSNVLADEDAPQETVESSKPPPPKLGFVIGVLWGYSPATQTGKPLRFALGLPVIFKAGPVGIVVQVSASSAFTAFDLSPGVLMSASGPIGPILRIGGGVLYSYTPPWAGPGSGKHLVGANGAIQIQIIPKRFKLGLTMGPRYRIGSDTVNIGGAVLFIITPG